MKLLACGCNFVMDSRETAWPVIHAAWVVILPPFKTAAAITTAAVAVQFCKRAGVDPLV